MPDRSDRPRRGFWRSTWFFVLFVMPLAIVVVGSLFWAGGSALLAYTESNEYCTSCHELTPVIDEYHDSVHFRSASGVRAGCADCHVPDEFWPSVLDHAHALLELYRHFDGTIETPELFEENRLRLARQVWHDMETSNSRECRSCHVPDAFDFAAQRPEARTAMEPLAEEHGGNCITCHRGLVHALPDMEAAAAEEEAARMAELSGGGEGPVADTMAVLETSPFSLAAGSGATDAQVFPGSMVSVLGTEGDQVHVRLDGWQQEGAERVMYALAGHRILTASLQPPAQQALQTGESQTLALTGQTWTEIALEGWLPRSQLTADVDQLWAYAGETYRAACSVCHTVHPPDQFMANQWVGQMQAMRDRTTITPEQYRLILRYLQMNARDVAGGAGGGQGGEGGEEAGAH